MKTNHRRGFIARNDVHWRGMQGGQNSAEERQFTDRTIMASSNCESSNGHRGMARQKAGAKKYVRSRTRFHSKIALRNEVDQNEVSS